MLGTNGSASGAYVRGPKCRNMVFGIESNDVWLDLGGHIGVWTRKVLLSSVSDPCLLPERLHTPDALSAAQPSTTVVTLEPNSTNFHYLERNTQRFRARSTIIRAACVPVRGKRPITTLFLHPTHPSRHTTMAPTAKSVKFTEERVPLSYTLPELLARYPLTNAIKIDVQVHLSVGLPRIAACLPEHPLLLTR